MTALPYHWLRRNHLPILLVAAIASAFGAYLAITEPDSASSPFGPDPAKVGDWLVINLALLTALSMVVGRRIWMLWRSFEHGAAGSSLQRKIVATFSAVTIIPTLTISIFSAIFFNLGIQSWFNERVNTAVEESLAVAQAYIAEHRENIRTDAISMAHDLDNVAFLARTDPIEFNRVVAVEAERRSLTEVIVFQRNRIIAQGRFSFALAFESLPLDAIERAENGEVVFLSAEAEDKVRAMIRLESLEDTYLVVGRLVDGRVIAHMEKTQGAVNEYVTLKGKLGQLQYTFSALFITLTLLLLLSVVWWGFVFAAKLSTPISRLAAAAERIRGGDFSARVQPGGDEDEITVLARTFNRMGEQLQAQRGDLIQANRELDARRRFTEDVLAGVSAGVIALDHDGKVTLHNRSAAAILLAVSNEQMSGRAVSSLIPGIQELLTQAETQTTGMSQGTMSIPRGNRSLSLHVRVKAEREGLQTRGFTVTFDDVTPLAAAQRQAAWADVARRVAHEIKNPLTPIALAAERLKRKYSKYVEGEEAETFARYTDTIARHVSDIGRIVEEFVSFARMPAPVFKEHALVPLVKKVIFSEQVAHPDIAYHAELTNRNAMLRCDEGQISQALSNLMKNAAEALEHLREQGKLDTPSITVRLICGDEQIDLSVEDNGPGFSQELLARAAEPYVTTRTKGTGLGLAIVKKIAEDHGGRLHIGNLPGKGARVTLSFLQQCDIKGAQ